MGDTTHSAIRNGVRIVPGVEKPEAMEGEIRALRATIDEAQESLRSGEGDLAKTGALLARLADSLGRALLVQQRLAANNDQQAGAAREIEVMLRQWKETDED